MGKLLENLQRSPSDVRRQRAGLINTGAERDKIVMICMYECIWQSMWFIVLMPLELLICLVMVRRFVKQL